MVLTPYENETSMEKNLHTAGVLHFPEQFQISVGAGNFGLKHCVYNTQENILPLPVPDMLYP
jgi:hypothetical protein